MTGPGVEPAPLDGVGGAHLNGGSGLLGLSDRAAALNGDLGVQSARGAGTVVRVRLPLGPARLPRATGGG